MHFMQRIEPRHVNTAICSLLLLLLLLDPLFFALLLPLDPKKHKQEINTSKQLQEYANSLTELRLECFKLEKELQRITRELDSIKISHVEQFGVS